MIRDSPESSVGVAPDRTQRQMKSGAARIAWIVIAEDKVILTRTQHDHPTLKPRGIGPLVSELRLSI